MICQQNYKVPKYRIGKDLHIHWEINTNNESEPLAGRDLTLFVVTPHKTSIRYEFSVDSNILDFVFAGKDQKIVGKYSLTLWENKGKENQSVLDSVDAFELVPLTSMECHE